MLNEDLYYELEELLTLGFKEQGEYDRYIKLKSLYEEETLDYSFSIRELTNQLEVIINTKENDFPNLDECLHGEYLYLVNELKRLDCNIAGKYISLSYDWEMYAVAIILSYRKNLFCWFVPNDASRSGSWFADTIHCKIFHYPTFFRKQINSILVSYIETIELFWNYHLL